MILADLGLADVRRRLRERGLFLRMDPFSVHLRSNLPDLAPVLHQLYAYYSLGDELFADFHISLRHVGGWRRWWRPQVQFRIDHEFPFEPFPTDTALPFLEWGINWCVAQRMRQFLLLHAGVLENQGKALLLSAWPGSGKSTLCAALCHRGWRLLSDEFGLVRPADCAIVPFPRLIPLKNESIPVIRAFAPEAVLGPVFPKTRKGAVAHMRPPLDSIVRARETAQARWIIFPHFEAGAEIRLQPLSKERAFLKFAGNSFNYELIGERGFAMASDLIETCDCYLFQYSDLNEAVGCLTGLLERI